MTADVGKALTHTIGKDMKLTIGQGFEISVAKDHSNKVKGEILISSDKEITLKCGSSSIVMKKDGTITIKGKDITIKGSGKISAKASGNMTLKGQKILEN
jgi:type VI secretion system secreted protein VgrG